MRKATNDDTVENRFPRAVIVKNLTRDLTRGDPLNKEEFTPNRFSNAIDSRHSDTYRNEKPTEEGKKKGKKKRTKRKRKKKHA